MTKFLNLGWFLLFLSQSISLHSYASVATNFECPRNLAEYGPSEYRGLGSFKVPRVKLPNPENAAVSIYGAEYLQKIASKYVTNLTPSSDFIDILNQVYKSVKKRRIDGVKKAKLIGEFGAALDPLFEKMIARYPVRGSIASPRLDLWKKRYDAIQDVKRMKFTLAMTVQDLENFGLEDYVKVRSENFAMTSIADNRTLQTHMPLEEYPAYIESYVAGRMGLNPDLAKLYNDIPERAPGGILSISDIRDITSYNTWPMYLKSHDVRHIHYGLSHPFALAVMMRATRSRVPLRYTILGGLYEGVDRVQYSQETSINRFFATEVGGSSIFPNVVGRNMDLEESMLMLAYVPEAKLTELSNTISSGSQFIEYANGVRDWRPKRIIGTDLNGRALTNAGRTARRPGIDLEEDVKEMVFRFERMHLQSEALKEKLRLHPETELSEDQKMLLWSMNFQLNPESPEIVIEGLRFKNDGRAHYYSGTLEDPIGIGDH
jgi:hypothetical protein